ncbi:MAG: bacterioferritin-associated ferredoxin [Paracoccaceae bacterium]|nr:MAG: (2Fe-2S)-binding protein [Alphaproteobacteria bacterium]GIX14082.1 MAG: bacterioferritin-associated ferredoxin [Paracoccaceae bacterium]
MIVCSCTGITDRDIRAAVDWMRAADPDTLITPGKVYRALGRAPDCGGCMGLFLSVLRGSPGCGVPVLRPPRTAGAAGRAAPRGEGVTDEGRPEGHRISQPRAAQ